MFITFGSSIGIMQHKKTDISIYMIHIYIKMIRNSACLHFMIKNEVKQTGHSNKKLKLVRQKENEKHYVKQT